MRKVYDTEIVEKEATLAKHKNAILEARQEQASVKGETQGIIEQQETAQRGIRASETRLTEVNQRVEQQEIEVERLRKAKSSLEIDISALDSTKSQRESENQQLKDQKLQLEQLVQTLDDDYQEKQAEKTRSLAILDAKLLQSTQELEANKASEDQTRKQLADWHRKLEGREQNLRIREAKATQSEDKIVRNSHLLDL